MGAQSLLLLWFLLPPPRSQGPVPPDPVMEYRGADRDHSQPRLSSPLCL